ncbi:HAD-IB family phosphatase [Selenomonas sp. FC4001]|uniref:HAD-IB family phosphatase n=1 Tax=Selenomonas sp. FC4001 TaxID=1408313 RepID=UPI000568E783|nr:HAD-IB family phosphatase [Selenomonas sp. FC4001]
MKPQFLFDLDGTITKIETLPLIAEYFSVSEEISGLTKKTIEGKIPFIESFIKRVFILRNLPISQVRNLLYNVELYSEVVDFIKKNSNCCSIVTGNIFDWVEPLAGRVGCKLYASEANVDSDKIIKLEKIIKKEDIVEYYQKQGCRVVFVGDGNNDAEAMRMADIAIASGLTHQPAMSAIAAADYLVYEEKTLCRQLRQILEIESKISEE